MLTRLDDFASRKGGRAVLAAGLAFAAVMGVMTWAVTAFHDAHGVGILNLSGARNAADPRTGGYSPDQAYQWLQAYGPDGRGQHLAILLLDLPLIASAALLTGLGLHLAARRLGPPGVRRTRGGLVAVALVGPALNLVEDLGLTVLLTSHPTRLDALAQALSWVNTAKSAMYSLTLIATVIALALTGVATGLRRGLPGRRTPPGHPATEVR